MKYVSGQMATASQRFQLLIPWLNGDRLPHEDVVFRVMWFIAETGLIAPQEPSVRRAQASERVLASLRLRLLKMLSATVAAPNARPRPPFETMWPLPSLRYQAIRIGDMPAKLAALSAAERRAHFGPGRYQMVVSGDLDDVLFYSVMRTLTEPGAIELARCPAPATHDKSYCDRLFIVTGRRRGRRREYCSDSCRVRRFKKLEADNTRREKDAANRKDLK
jgi:hypothetical protein